MKKRSCFTLLLGVIGNLLYAQDIPADRLTDWSTAGYNDSLPAYNNTLNILNYGGVGDGSTPNDNAVKAALSALNNRSGTIYFPVGDYAFTSSIDIDQDSVILKGDGVATRLLFDLGGVKKNLINVSGKIEVQDKGVLDDVARNGNKIIIDKANNLSVNDYLLVSDADTANVHSPWAYSTTGQIVRINVLNNDTAEIDGIFRRTYLVKDNPKVHRIRPVQYVGIECMYIERLDSTTTQTHNINFDKAAYSWVSGVESKNTNFAHVAVNYSSHIHVKGSYFHHAFSYGGGGKAYGALVQFTSSDCLIENNVFEHLRHSMLVQAGANGNVFAYNYSTDPYWDEVSLPADAAGDIVCHGNYPYSNLFEGNIVQTVVVDDSHGINGPYNTFYRNRAEKYGVFTNNNPSSDSNTYAGNEVTAGGLGKGLYVLNGVGNYEYGNNIKGSVQPSVNDVLKGSSLYLLSPPSYWDSHANFPNIGERQLYNNSTIPAKQRFAGGNSIIDCNKNRVYTSISEAQAKESAINIYPNPSQGILTIEIADTYTDMNVSITDVMGKKVYDDVIINDNRSIINLSHLPDAVYLVEVRYNNISIKEKIVISR